MHEGEQEDEPADYSVSGHAIRVMWDYGVRIPLRDGHGLMPEEPEWLSDALGLGAQLIDNLTRWGLDMEEFDLTPRRKPGETRESLNARGQELAQRLQGEVGSRFNVRYRPW